MEMASLTNTAEHNTFKEFSKVILNCTEACSVWIGANDLATENSFVWSSSGKKVEFDKWRDDQPDNGFWNEEKEHCVEIVYNPSEDWFWEWNDFVCGSDGHFACEAKKDEIIQFK